MGWIGKGNTVQKQEEGMPLQKRLENSAGARPPQGPVAQVGTWLGLHFRKTLWSLVWRCSSNSILS